MANKLLLCSPPVERLRLQMQRLAPPQRAAAWRIYANLRRQALRGTLGQALEKTTAYLAGSVSGALPYRAVTLAIKLAQTYTEQHLSLCGAACRPERAHVRESFFLLRQGLRAALGQRVLEAEPVWKRGPGALLKVSWLAVCDGSCKTATSSVGLLVYDPQRLLRAEVGLPVSASTAVEAELQACVLAMRTLLALGARHATVQVDASSVLVALARKLPLRYRVHEAELLSLAARFRVLEVHLVPRVTTYQADRLAAKFSRNEAV